LRPGKPTAYEKSLSKQGKKLAKDMKKRLLIAAVSLLILGSPVIALAQTPGYALEVTYFKGRPFAYQKLSNWSWYALFQRVPGWRGVVGETPVEAVKIAPRTEQGSVKIRVSVLKGKFLETEQQVGDYTITENVKFTIVDLSKFGVIPFEVSLVRAPATVAGLPALINKSRSLQVSVAPDSGSLPTFQLKLINDSAKAVRAFTYETTADGRPQLSAMPHRPEGGILIAPGGTYEEKVRIALDAKTTSTGEVSAAVNNVTVQITSVIFADATYEGDIYQAARYRAAMLGERTQLKRILEVLRSDTADTAIDILYGQVSDLTWYVDEPAFEGLVKEIGGMNEKMTEDLHEIVLIASNDVQKNFAAEFGEKRNSMGDKRAEFQAWLKTAAERYQKWLSALSQ
jgi:hypothetical protein